MMGLLLFAVCYHLPFRQSPFCTSNVRLSECATCCSLYTAHFLLMTACYTLLTFCCSLLAIDRLLLAVLFLFLTALFSFLVTRPLAARCLLLTAPFPVIPAVCPLFLTRYPRPNCRFYLLALCRPLIAARTRI